jgi:hypothetical protein
MLNAPVGDKSRSVRRLERLADGYAYNRYDNKDFATGNADAVRVGMSWDITDDVNWTVKYDYSKIGGDGKAELEIDPNTLTAASRARLTLITGGNPPDLDDAFDRKSNQRIKGDVHDTQSGVVSDLSWHLANDYTVRFLGGYRKWDNDQLESDVLSCRRTPARGGDYASKSQSYELQLISPKDELGGRLIT